VDERGERARGAACKKQNKARRVRQDPPHKPPSSPPHRHRHPLKPDLRVAGRRLQPIHPPAHAQCCLHSRREGAACVFQREAPPLRFGAG